MSKNEDTKKANSLLAKLSEIEIHISPSRKDVNMAGAGIDINIGVNSTPTTINTNLLNSTNLEDLLNHNRIEDMVDENAISRDRFMEIKEYADAKRDEFDDLQLEASMIRKEISLIQTMV